MLILSFCRGELACIFQFSHIVSNILSLPVFSEIQKSREVDWLSCQREEAARLTADHIGRLLREWRDPTDPPTFSAKQWNPKNPEIQFPSLAKEISLPFGQWKAVNFPSFSVPDKVTTHVNIDYWTQELNRLSSRPEHAAARLLMATVLEQLTNGADSMVGPPGNQLTTSTNFFPSPPEDIPRMMDSLANEVKSEHMAGPLHPASAPDVKVNGFMAVPKPSGDRRQVHKLQKNVQDTDNPLHTGWKSVRPSRSLF